jgi:replicative DNA helicase
MTESLRDPAAERGVLAGIFQYGTDAFVDVADIVTIGSFSDPTNQVLFRCFESALASTPNAVLDLPTLLSSAKALGVAHVLDKPAEAEMVRAVINMPVRKENIRRLAAKVQKLAVTRTLAGTMEEALAKIKAISGDEPINHILGLAESPLTDFSNLMTGDGGAPVLLGSGLRGYIEHVMSNPVDQIGISTGFFKYDKAIGGGLRRKTVNLIGARPKTGKTIFGMNAGVFISYVLGIPVLYLDTEMSQQDHWHRALAKLARVPIDEIETGKFAEDPKKKERVLQSIEVLEKSPFHFRSIAGQPFEETLAMMRRWVKRDVGLDENGRARDCVVIFDYLKLMSSESLTNNLAEYQVLGFMMTGLHNFMVRHDVPCLSFAQLNRDGIDKESTDVVSQSDRIIWLCSNFSIYKKKTQEEIAEERGMGVKDAGNRKLIPLVSRHGGGLEDESDYINCKFEGEFATITEGKTRNEVYRFKPRDGFEVTDDASEIPFD